MTLLLIAGGVLLAAFCTLAVWSACALSSSYDQDDCTH